MTWPLTLADDSAECRRLLVLPHLHPEDEPIPRPARVRAPCCGRKTAADTVIDLRGITGTVLRGGNRNDARDHEWACDGCIELLLHQGPAGKGSPPEWSRSALARELGAPASVIREYRAREIAEEAINRGHREDEQRPDNQRRGVDPGAEYARALASLPEGVRDLPGTARPKLS